MSLFQTYSLTVTRDAAGAYVSGRWVDGADEPDATINTSWQPAIGKDLEALPEGLRQSSVFKGYPSTQINTVNQFTLEKEDIIIGPDSKEYRVVFVGPWQNGIIPHYKFMVVRKKELS